MVWCLIVAAGLDYGAIHAAVEDVLTDPRGWGQVVEITESCADFPARPTIWVIEPPIIPDRPGRLAQAMGQHIILPSTHDLWTCLLNHEVGHTLGLGHSEHGLMQPQCGEDEWPGPAEFALVAA